jgi:putative oxidoreductase
VAFSMSRFSDSSYTLLRVVAGLLFAEHGAQKLFGLFGGPSVPPFSLMMLAGIIELTCGVLVALGVFTRYVAFLAAGEMAVAYFRMHAPHGFWPIQNRGELAVLYCFVFLFIAFHGSRRWALRRDRG